MEYVSVSTTQNIDLEYQIAGIGDRILAFGFDLLVIGSWAIIWLIILTSIGDLELWNVVLGLPIVFYSLIAELFFNGQTFGKMVLRIKVAKLDGSELTLGSCLIRWVFRIVDIWLLFGSFGVISILASNKSQRLGDIVTGTTVVKLSRKNLFEETAYIEVPENYKLAYQESSQLVDNDASTIKEVLNFVEMQNDTGTKNNCHPMQVKLQNALKQKLGINQINGSAKKFLQDLLKDYNFLHK